MFSSTGSGARDASDCSALVRPCAVSTAGCRPACQLAQFLQRGGEFVLGDRQQPLGLRPGRELPAEDGQAHRERDEPLLGAVVQVALETAALLVGGIGRQQHDGPAQKPIDRRIRTMRMRPGSSWRISRIFPM